MSHWNSPWPKIDKWWVTPQNHIGRSYIYIYIKLETSGESLHNESYDECPHRGNSFHVFTCADETSDPIPPGYYCPQLNLHSGYILHDAKMSRQAAKKNLGKKKQNMEKEGREEHGLFKVQKYNEQTMRQHPCMVTHSATFKNVFKINSDVYRTHFGTVNHLLLLSKVVISHGWGRHLLDVQTPSKESESQSDVISGGDVIQEMEPIFGSPLWWRCKMAEVSLPAIISNDVISASCAYCINSCAQEVKIMLSKMATGSGIFAILHHHHNRKPETRRILLLYRNDMLI